jgi:hypothetical protein
VSGLLLKWTIFFVKTLRDLSVALPDIALILLVTKAASMRWSAFHSMLG